MSGQGSKTPWLLGAVLILGAVVLGRQFLGGGGGGGGDGGSDGVDAPSAKERYLEAVALSRRQRALLDNAEAWRGALAGAERAWDTVRREAVRARTVELAEASFRERVLAEVKDLRFTDGAANSVPVPVEGVAAGTGAAPAGLPAVRAIGLRVEVRTDSPAEVYRLIDRIENLPDVRAGVVGVEIKGPGLAQTPPGVSATIDVRAVALIGEDAL